MNKDKCLVLCGIFAMVDNGLPIPDRRSVKLAIQNSIRSVEQSVQYFTASYIEDENMSSEFEDSANSWFKQLSNISDDTFAATWKDMAELWDKSAAG